MKSLVLAAVMLAAGAFFVRTVRHMLRFIRDGRPENRTDRLGDRVASVLTYFLGQKKVPEPVGYDDRPGVTSMHHLWIFWGFLIITIGTALPVGASPSPAAAPAARAAELSPDQGVTATMPGCIVQGALMYPLFIAMVMVLNPSAIPSAPSEYWNGSKQSPGRLEACGI